MSVFKKVLSYVLAVSMLLTMTYIPAFAVDEPTIGFTLRRVNSSFKDSESTDIGVSGGTVYFAVGFSGNPSISTQEETSDLLKPSLHAFQLYFGYDKDRFSYSRCYKGNVGITPSGSVYNEEKGVANIGATTNYGLLKEEGEGAEVTFNTYTSGILGYVAFTVNGAATADEIAKGIALIDGAINPTSQTYVAMEVVNGNESNKAMAVDKSNIKTAIGSLTLDSATPTVNGTEVTVTPSVKDQNNVAIDAANVNLTVAPQGGADASKVTVSGNSIKVAGDAVNGAKYTVTASGNGTNTWGKTEAELTVTRAASALTTVELSASTVAVPTTSTANELTITAKDQFGAAVSSGVTYAITAPESHEGIMIEGNKIKVAKAASALTFTNNSLTATVTATQGETSKTANFTVTREAPAVTNVTVSGEAAVIEVPTGDTPKTDGSFSATVTDQYGNTMNGQTITWGLKDGETAFSDNNITITNGVVSVTKDAKTTIADTTGKALTVTATVGGVTGEAANKVTVKRADAVLTTIGIARNGSTTAITATENLTIPANAQAADKTQKYVVVGFDQYGDYKETLTNDYYDWMFTPTTADAKVTFNEGTVTVKNDATANGTFKLKATMKDNTQKTAEITIKVVDIDVTWPEITVKNSSPVYGDTWGNILQLQAGGSAKVDTTDVPGTFSIVCGETKTAWNTASASVPNAGTQKYTIQFTSTDGSYTVYKEDSTISVAKKELAVSWANTDLTYNGSEQKPTATAEGAVNGETVALTVSGGATNATTEAATATAALGTVTGGNTLADNYTLKAGGAGVTDGASTTFTIAKKSVTVSGITASDKVYDGDTTATVNATTATFAGRVGSDELTITATGAFADKNVGASKTVNLTLGALGGTSAANYQLASAGNQATTTAAITAKPVTVSSGITASDKVYDGNTTATVDATAAEFAGKVDGDTLTITATGTFADKDVGTGKQVGLTLGALGGASAANYALASTGNQTTATADITAKALTVGAGEGFTVTKEYDGKLTSWEVDGELALTGVVSGDTVTTTGTVTASGNENKGHGTYEVDVTGYSLSGEDAGNYTVSNSSFSFDGATITKPTMELTASITGWTYGGYVAGTNAPNVSITKGPAVGSEGTTVTYAYKVKDAADTTYNATVPTNAGNYTVRATVTNNNWENGVATADFTIAKAALTVTAKPKTITYGDAPANDGVTYEGFANGETASVLSGTLAYEYNYNQYGDVNAGSYTITPKGLTSDNYDITFTAGTLTVTKKEIAEVTWGETALTYTGAEQVPAAVVKGLVTTDSGKVTVTVTGGQTNANAGPSGALLESKTAYTATVSELAGAKAANYKLATTKPATEFMIKQVPVTITGVKATWDAANKKATLSGGVINGLLSADAEKVAIDLPESGTVAADASGANVAVTATIGLKATAGNTEADKNYSLTSVNAITVDIPLENTEVAATATTAKAPAAGVNTGDATVQTVTNAIADTASFKAETDAASGDNGIADAAKAISSDSTVITTAKMTEAQTAVKALEGLSGTNNADIIVVVKPVVDIQVKAVATDSNAVKTFTVDITPSYELVATTKNAYNNGSGTLTEGTNSVTLSGSKKAMTVTEPVKLSVPVPAAFYTHDNQNHKIFVTHTHGNATYEYVATVKEATSGKYVAEFTTPHGFSEFVFALEQSPFMIGDVPYATLTAAVAAVKNGETITVTKAMGQSEAVPAVSRAVSFTIEEATADNYKGTITAAAGYENTNATTKTDGKAVGTYTFVKLLSATASPSSVAAGTVGTAITPIQITAQNGTAPYTFGKASGPDWLSVDESGKVTGTRPSAAVASPDNLVVTVADATGKTYPLTITVGAVSTSGGSNSNTGNTGTGSPAGTADNTTAKISTSVSGTTATVTVKDSDLAAAAKAGSASAPIVIDVSKAGKTIDTVSLPAGFAAKVSALETAGGLEVALTTGELTFNDKALDAIAAAGSGSISLSLEKQSESSLAAAQKTALAGMTVSGVYDLSLKVTGKAVESFNGGTATVSVPFTPAAGTKGSDYAVLYVSDTGATERMATSYLNGELTFTTGHFSTYVVVYDPAQFTDVVAGSFYEAAVKWAVGKGITTGTSATTFSPDAPCTRAQAVTFLYRAAGEPEVTLGAAFTDVKAGSYYEKAVAWAVANGITNGVGADQFAPDAACTRAQIVTFLARYEKAAAVSSDRFTDVAADAYYAGAVGWAVANGITNGTGATQFSPEATCTRAQIVTFLYRDFVK